MPEAIRYLSEWLTGVTLAPLAPDVAEGWSRFNPSLVLRADGRLTVCVRSSNYRIDAAGGYAMSPPGDAIRTRNLLGELDGGLRLGPARPLVAPDEVVVTAFPVHGYEDVRLFESSRGAGALATVRDRVADGLCRVALLDVAEDGRVTRERVVVGPVPGRHEKNWVPIEVVGSTLHFVYGWSPVVMGTLDLDSAEVRLGEPVPSPWAGARGGAGGARLGNERLFVVHESAPVPGGSRRYVHRFVTLDADGAPARASPLLALLGRGIEFAAGLVIVDDHVLVSFGLEDEEAWIARFPVSVLDERLVAIDAPSGIPSTGAAP